jgi:hypothetical protein
VVLLVLLPVLFITLSFYITPDDPAPVELVEAGTTSIEVVSMIDVHGAIMVPITIGFLAGLAGLFVVQGSLQADARLALAGFRLRQILASRLGIIGLAALLTTGVSLAVTAVDFTPQSWGWFTAGSVLVAATYGMAGVLIGALFGRLGGLYLMFLLPFIDVGIGQNIMFSAAPPDWGILLPARGAVRVLIDAAFTLTFDQIGGLWLAIAWLIGLAAVTGSSVGSQHPLGREPGFAPGRRPNTHLLTFQSTGRCTVAAEADGDMTKEVRREGRQGSGWGMVAPHSHRPGTCGVGSSIDH